MNASARLTHSIIAEYAVFASSPKVNKPWFRLTMASRPGGPLVAIADLLREGQPGHRVGQQRHVGPQRFGDELIGVRLIRQHQDRVRVGVVDEARRQERMQQRLDRGRG